MRRKKSKKRDEKWRGNSKEGKSKRGKSKNREEKEREEKGEGRMRRGKSKVRKIKEREDLGKREKRFKEIGTWDNDVAFGSTSPGYLDVELRIHGRGFCNIRTGDQSSCSCATIDNEPCTDWLANIKLSIDRLINENICLVVRLILLRLAQILFSPWCLVILDLQWLSSVH
jgi:hypothetical protein